MATLSVPLLYRLSGFTLADEVQWLEQREAQEHTGMVTRLDSLRVELAALNIDEGVRQADTLAAILEDYHAVVETRFIGKKRSPLAYLSSARQVQKHAVQNLNDVIAVGHSLASISRHHLDDIQSDSATTKADADNNADTGKHTDERRDRLHVLNQEQSMRLQQLLEQNQKLFDALTATAVEVANIKSFSDYERMDTLARLVSLAEIANQKG